MLENIYLLHVYNIYSLWKKKKKQQTKHGKKKQNLNLVFVNNIHKSKTFQVNVGYMIISL